MSEHLPPEALDGWAAQIAERLGLAPEDLPISAVLDLAGVVARGVARPAAPVSTFAAGLAAGRAGGSADDVRRAIAEITDLVTEREA